jgi:hypothetical protein
MDEPGAISTKMRSFLLPRRPAREQDEPLLDLILDGHPLPPDASHDAHALADRLAGLAGPAEPGVLPGEAAARSAFAAQPAVRRPGRRRPRLRAALAAALVAVTAGLGSTMAADADVLPGPVQDFAHHVIGAPPAHHAKPRPGKDKHSKTSEHKVYSQPKSSKPAKPPKPLESSKPAKPPKPTADPKVPKASGPPKPPKPVIARSGGPGPNGEIDPGPPR